MPRKDGSPTAAEKKDAARIEGNRRFLLAASIDDLKTIEADNAWDPEVAEAIKAERIRRGDFANIVPGTLPVGVAVPQGVITAVTLTAYRFEYAGRSEGWYFLPFAAIHGTPKVVEPLVVFS